MHEFELRLSDYKFESKDDEIYFFKNIKPDFYKLLIYYHKVYSIEISKPVEIKRFQIEYYQSELIRVREFFQDNKFFYQYLRAGETDLDEKLFLRRKIWKGISRNLEDLHVHPEFSTGYDNIISRIQAYEMLVEYLNNSIVELQGNRPLIEPTPAISKLTWTESKTAMIELAYALQSAGVFNGGNAELKQIVEFLEQSLNIELGNTSRTFQEILFRKTGYTIFLDKLKAKLLERIEKIEEREK
ncbi:MAG TPA: RteC domain-containing protein [Flavitalea sp.]|nr:RteC domain-containing protein [Flavitalea sp.]